MDEQQDKGILQYLKNNENIEITPSKGIADIGERPGYQKLEPTQAQRIQIGGLLQELPALTASATLADAYVISFPNGIPNALTPLKQGGYSTMVKGENGRFVGTASLYAVDQQAMILGAFNTMSIVSGQYFLAEINSQLKSINQSLDAILSFLYGDKKAELMAEISFTRYAYENYISIMEHDQQRTATIASLQEAKKVAMKDIEFYMSDLDTAMNSKNGSDIVSLVDKIFQIKECLGLSIQLYVMSSTLEVYYAQNNERNYIRYMEEDAVIYISKCEKRILTVFSALRAKVQGTKDNIFKKIDKSDLEKRIDLVIDELGQGVESETCKTLRSALHSPERKTEYYIGGDGIVYLKNG